MKKIFIILSIVALIIFLFSTCVYAEENIENATLITNSISINEKLDQSDELGSEFNQNFENNFLSSSEDELIITDDNYNQYFNKFTGKLKENVDISNVKTLKIGNISNKFFVIEKQFIIQPISSDCQIKNGLIHLMPGSDGCTIKDLTINNTKGYLQYDGIIVSKLHGIWFTNSSDNLIYNNTILIAGEEGCYAMPMGYSNRNKILYNKIITVFTSCIVMGSADYNNISFNHIEVTSYRNMVTSNLIYFSGFGFADFNGPGECIGTYISNNYLKGVSNDIWSYILALEGQCDNTQVINNTIIKGYFGIYLYNFDSPFEAKNVLIYGNTIIDSLTSIVSASNNVTISKNNITGSSMSYGIWINGHSLYESHALISENYINYDNLYHAIYVSSANVTINNNHIFLSRYGVGINLESSRTSNPDNCIITRNNIQVKGDEGISVYANNATISDNLISTKSKGIVITGNPKSRRYNNRIISNIILSEKHAIYIEGCVFNTSISNNVINSNQTDAIYVNVENTLDDNNWGTILDNSINGVVENSNALIVNDDNFYDYFDSEGYLKYEFESTGVIFFTFLSNKNIFFTDQISLSSNKMSNLLFNVSITFKEDSYGSSVSDLKFYNINKNSIVLDSVENVIISNNEFSTITTNVFDVTVISILGSCIGCKISDNDIFINSKAYYTYAISVSDSSNSIYKSFSKNFTISNNNILIKSLGISEAMYFDLLVESDIINNHINIKSEDSAYGISICNIMQSPYDLKIDSNEIVINAKEMSYLIEIYSANSCEITNNYIIGASNGIYGVGIYDSKNIIVEKNEIAVYGHDLTSKPVFDALGKGNNAIYINKSSIISSISDNVIYIENCQILSNSNSVIEKLGLNSYVISDNNYDLYFNSKNKLISSILKNGDIILFKNITSSNIMEIDVSVTIKPYKHYNEFHADLILSNGSDNSSIYGIKFINAKIVLKNTNNIKIYNNVFLSDEYMLIHDIGGFYNKIYLNEFLIKINGYNSVIFEKTTFNSFNFNNVSFTSNSSKFLVIKEANKTSIYNNQFNVSGNSLDLIVSNSSFNNDILNNEFSVDVLSNVNVYDARKTKYDNLINNSINIKSVSAKMVIHYDEFSSKNNVQFNKIISYSDEGTEYAIIFDTKSNLFNVIANNYLITSNGYRRANDAVYAVYELVCNNTPVDIFVSSNVGAIGNGSIENPFSTIHEAIENSLSGTVIYIFPGYYNESNLVIDKNITLTSINLEGSVYIDALKSQLFNIKSNGILTIKGLKILNGYSIKGGSLFTNLGTLIINNSMIYNCSSYYNNSNPMFTTSKYDKTIAFSHDCKEQGLGGAILNYGNLIIDSSKLFNNFAHKGGFLANFGKTTIKNSLIFNNTGVHGGAIYTEGNEEFIIDNSYLFTNIAIQTLDYCFIQRKTIDRDYQYIYSSLCGIPAGYGGAIFSNSFLKIKNSRFEYNFAKCGGAIAQPSDLQRFSPYHEPDYSSLGLFSTYVPTAKLSISNSIFKYNEAKNTSSGNLTMLIDVFGYYKIYTINFQGGAIFGSLAEAHFFNSSFEHNAAFTNGGALCIQCQNSIIEGCNFYNNTAGSYGGALDVFGNFQVFNTNIINNSAKNGGALQYSSYESYNHLQNKMNLFNVTVAGNKALETGGAFVVSLADFAITNSNIYGNDAPLGSTFSAKNSERSVIDARSNWWGSVDGPDDSIWAINNIRFKKWASDKIDWGIVHIYPHESDEGYYHNDGNNHNSPIISTGTSIHTGSTLNDQYYNHKPNDYSFLDNWPSQGSNGYNDVGYGGGNGNSGSNSGNGRTTTGGAIENPNSLSKVNSSNINDLSSVGMKTNAADSSGSSYSGGGEKSVNAYEINKEIKKEINSENLYLMLFLILFVMFCIGFYRKTGEI